MYLGEIRGAASKFAETISKIFDVDVMIIDNNYNRIANTFIYANDPTPITRYTIIGEVLHTGKVVAVKNKAIYQHCKNCSDLEECAISGLVSVPIFFEQKVIGAIALLVPNNKTSPIFENLEISIDFLEKMSDLLSSKLKNIDDYNKLNLIKKEREIILDMLEDGLVFLNDVGEVMHCNHQFEKFFRIEKQITGQHIEKIIDHPLIHDTIVFRKNFSHKLFYYEEKSYGFYGFLSCHNITLNAVNYGFLLTFKSLGRVYNVLNEASDNKTNISFNDIVGKDAKLIEEINKAKQLAVTNEIILISSEPGLGKSVFAKAIHNFSDRAQQYFVCVDCYNKPYDLLEKEIFGYQINENPKTTGIGKLRMGHKGTIFFKNINDMPLYLQQWLVDIIKTKQLKQGTYKDFPIDVRMIFDTRCDIASLVERGMFNEELYFRISKNIIRIPPLSRRKGDIKIIVDDTIEKLKAKHLKTHLKFDKGVLEKMYGYSWPNNIDEVQKTVELLIGNAKGCNITLEDVRDFDFVEFQGAETKTVEVMERELIEKMLAKYQSKTEMAKAMGIGRATLYRKLRKYGMI